MATKRITGALVEAMEPGQVVFDDTVRGFMVRHRAGSPRDALKTRIKGFCRKFPIWPRSVR